MFVWIKKIMTLIIKNNKVFSYSSPSVSLGCLSLYFMFCPYLSLALPDLGSIGGFFLLKGFFLSIVTKCCS